MIAVLAVEVHPEVLEATRARLLRVLLVLLDLAIKLDCTGLAPFNALRWEVAGYPRRAIVFAG